jgi:hypothetical protein
MQNFYFLSEKLNSLQNMRKQKRFYVENFWGPLLMQELCTFLKAAQKFASFNTLCGNF